jgi:tetratricopeptide (TPR) repeat protein
MNPETNERPQSRNDPFYAEGMAHLQSGQWSKAIRSFEESARQYGSSPELERALEEARFKAKIDAGTRVRPKQIIFPWRSAALRVLLVVVIALLAFFGTRMVSQQVAPALAQAQRVRQQDLFLNQGAQYLEAEKLDDAQKAFEQVLALAPDNAQAKDGLTQLAALRKRLDLYASAVALQESGSLTEALQALTELSVESPGYRDVNIRIGDINRQLQIEELFAQAEADYAAGLYTEATGKYQQVQGLNASFERDQITSRLFELYMMQGRELVARTPPAPELMPQALDFFTKALALQPRDTDAGTEQELASNFLAGQQAYQEKRWDDAAAMWGAVYDARPGYLGASLTEPLYQAYIASGDVHKDALDYYLAWEQYRRASELPVQDVTLARGRMAEVHPFLTPTPTPTNTPTVTPIPTATPYIPPTPIPSATPPAPLATYRNQIVFTSDIPEQKGLWVMNPDGSNRRFLGRSDKLLTEYKQLVTRESFSPDGRYRLFVKTGEGDNSPQIFVQIPVGDEGKVTERQLTHLSKISYDPVWAPDGSRVAFVSQEHGSDDVWVVDPDGENAANYTRNRWEWDKHPSWSPDSGKIVFWTNREGTGQIYVMDANGRNQTNISMVPYDEYDPIWIK